MNKYDWAAVAMAVAFAAVSFVVGLGSGRLQERQTWVKHPPTYVEVQCDNADLHLYPYAGPEARSNVDAATMANLLTTQSWCRSTNAAPTDHGVEG